MIAADRKFVVGVSADGKFTMLGLKGTFEGGQFIGSDGRRYSGIVRVVPFDSAKPEHKEFVPFRDYALRK